MSTTMSGALRSLFRKQQGDPIPPEKTAGLWTPPIGAPGDGGAGGESRTQAKEPAAADGKLGVWAPPGSAAASAQLRGDEQNSSAAEAMNERLRARVQELEAERGALAAVLRLPGVKMYLESKYYPDNKLGLNEAQRQWMNGRLQMVHAVYALIDRMGSA